MRILWKLTQLVPNSVYAATFELLVLSVGYSYLGYLHCCNLTDKKEEYMLYRSQVYFLTQGYIGCYCGRI